MSPVRWLVLIGFALRLAVGLVGEFRQIFPDYYYYDAVKYEDYAWRYAQAWRSGHLLELHDSVSHLNFGRFLGVFYFVFGRSPLILVAVNSLIGSLLVLVVYRTALLISRDPHRAPKVALWAAGLAAFWPSSLFWAGHLFRDPLIGLLTSGSVWLMAEWLSGSDQSRAVLPLSRTGPLLGSLFLAVGSAMFRVQQVGFWFLTLFGALAGLLLSGATSARQAVSRALAVAAAAGLAALAAALAARFVPYASYLLITPAKLTEWHQWVTRVPNESHGGTTLFPELVFHNWFDVFSFLPKGIFYVLFMPLPLVYPTDGNPGRLAAAGENLILLGFAALALGYIWKWRGGRPAAAWPVLMFVVLMASAQALTEPDLGSAMRHKFFYLPFIFMLGLDCLFERLERKGLCPKNASFT